MRSDHQPKEDPIIREAKTKAERQHVCGSLSAVVLALDTATTPLTLQFDDPDAEPYTFEPADGKEVCRPLQAFEGQPVVVRAVRTALDAGVEGVLVLAASELADEVRQALAVLEEAGEQVRLETVDLEADWETTLSHAGFELYGLSFGVLDAVRRFLEARDTEAAVLLKSDQARITADHIFELCSTWQEHKPLDCVTSWIVWARRFPLVVSRSFLGRLTDGQLARELPETGNRPIPRLDVEEHRFGEEKLAVSTSVPRAVEGFFQDLHLSALEAVRIAALEPDDRNAATKGMSASDAQLVEAACKVRALMEDARAAAGDRLVEADRFGNRNKMDFPLLCDRAHKDKLVYLDSAATTQRVDRALQAMSDFDLHENANVYRGAYDLSMQATYTLNDARKVLEDFIGANRRETVLTQNTSTAIALAASAWGENNIAAGDLIVTDIAEHHSCMLPWLMLAERKSAQVVFLEPDDTGRLDMEAYRKVFEEDAPVKLVALAHVSNVLGMVNPVCEMARIAHAHGARFLLDAAQSFAHMQLDVGELDADFVAFSGHKAYGPFGIGGLWISPEVFDECDPAFAGGGTVSHVSKDGYYLRPKAIQYELGTPPISQMVGFAAAIEYLQSICMDEVRLHGEVLTNYLATGLSQLEGVTIWGDHHAEDGGAGLVAFSLCGADPTAMNVFLGKLGVCIRAGSHCAIPFGAYLGVIGTGRISLGVYNTSEDIDAALTAIETYIALLHHSR